MLFVSVLVAYLSGAAAAPTCNWGIGVGSEVLDPSDAPLGRKSYIIQCAARINNGCEKLARALLKTPFEEELKALRVLRSMNFLTAEMGDNLLKWICLNPELSDMIDFVELDQAVGYNGEDSII